MLAQDGGHVLGLNEIIGDSSQFRGDDVHQHVVGAEPPTAGLDHITSLSHLGVDPHFGDEPGKLVLDLLGAGRDAAGSLADQYLDSRMFSHSLKCPLYFGSLATWAAGFIRR